MKNKREALTIILLLLGTSGLILNQWLFDGGRIATLIFAALNIVGLLLWFGQKAANGEGE